MKHYVLFSGGSLIDGMSREPTQNAGVLIEGPRIRKVGIAEKSLLPKDGTVQTVDVSGKTIMAGMIDCHVHFWYAVYASMTDDDLNLSPELNTIYAVRNARTYLESGFTSVRDVGTRGNTSIAIREAIDRGLILGP
jgi:imidazolonepropionase-like amidohydrolase